MSDKTLDLAWQLEQARQQTAELRKQLSERDAEVERLKAQIPGPQTFRVVELCGGLPIHSDDDFALRFCGQMRQKLARKREQGYSGWDNSEDCPVERLAKFLVDHLEKGDPVDIGNFAMMLYFRLGGPSALSHCAAGLKAKLAAAERDTKAMAQHILDGEDVGDFDPSPLRDYFLEIQGKLAVWIDRTNRAERELKAERGRLDWLQVHDAVIRHSGFGFTVIGWDEDRSFSPQGCSKNLREAIDAARKEGAEG